MVEQESNPRAEIPSTLAARSNPLVSVIVPTFGRAEKIGRARASIGNQTYDNAEIIVVDDNGETPEREATATTIASTVLKFPVRVVNTAGRVGGGRARNLGAEAASGTYLAFLDDDDLFLPEKISRQVEFMKVNTLDLSYQDVTWVDEAGHIVERRRLDHAKGFSRSELLRAHLMTPISPTAIYMIRRDFFDRTGGFGDVAVGQDWILMLRAIELSGNIKYMPGSFVQQYLHDGPRLSTGKRKLRGEKALQEVRKQYYFALTSNERRLVNFRHFAVLGFASARSRLYVRAAFYCLIACAVSPASALSQGRSYFRSRDESQS